MKLGGTKHNLLMDLAYDVFDQARCVTDMADSADVIGMLTAFNGLVDALREFGEAVAPIAVKELLG